MKAVAARLHSSDVGHRGHSKILVANNTFMLEGSLCWLLKSLYHKLLFAEVDKISRFDHCNF